MLQGSVHFSSGNFQGFMGKREIWVCADRLEAGELKKRLEEGNILNPIRVLEENFSFENFFGMDGQGPLIVLLDLSHARSWEIIAAARENGAKESMRIVALVDDSTEKLIDRAYDGGVKTYLRKPIMLAEFLLRLKMLDLNVVIERPTDTTDLSPDRKRRHRFLEA
jgi:AmiR/NasT family two-component response regulator